MPNYIDISFVFLYKRYIRHRCSMDVKLKRSVSVEPLHHGASGRSIFRSPIITILEELQTALQNFAVTFAETAGTIEESGSAMYRGASWPRHHQARTEAKSVLRRAATKLLTEELPVVGKLIIDGEMVDIDSNEPFLAVIETMIGEQNCVLNPYFRGLPHACSITIFPFHTGNQYGDAIASAVREYGSSIMWVATKHEDGAGWRVTLDAKECKTDASPDLTLSSQVISLDFSDEYGRSRFHQLFYHELETLMIVESGCAAYNLGLVATGTIIAYLSATLRTNVLAAMYPIITGAGGCVTAFPGEDYGTIEFSNACITTVVASANESIRDALLTRLDKTE